MVGTEETRKIRGRGGTTARGLYINDSNRSDQKYRPDDGNVDNYSSSRRYDSDDGDWLHDRYDLDQDEHSSAPARQQPPPDYKPPKPRWVSRAGGVAIMRNTIDSDDDDEYDMR